MDSGDKGCNKCMSIAHKYALLQCFMIPTEDLADPDAESHQLSPEPPLSKVRPQPKFEAPSQAIEFTPQAMALYESMISAATTEEKLNDIYKEYFARKPAKKTYDKLTNACKAKKAELKEKELENMSQISAEILDEETGEIKGESHA